MRKTLAVLLAFAVLTMFALTVKTGSTDNSPPVAVVAVVPEHTAEAVSVTSELVFYQPNASGAEVATAQIKDMDVNGAHDPPETQLEAERPEIVKRI